MNTLDNPDNLAAFLPPTKFNYTIGQIRGLRPMIRVTYELKNGETGTVGARAECRKNGWKVVFLPMVDPNRVTFHPTDAQILASVNNNEPLLYKESDE